MRTTLNLSADALAAVRQALRPKEAPAVRNGVPIFAAPPDVRLDAAAPDLDLVNRLRDEATLLVE